MTGTGVNPFKRAEIIGACGAAACFPLTLLNLGFGFFGPSGIVLPFLAGAVLCSLITSLVYQRRDPCLAPRAGIRAGLVASLLGGSLTVLAATCANWRQADATGVLFVVLLALPPSLSFVVATALCVALASAPSSLATPRSRPKIRPAWSSTAFAGICLIGYLSPFSLGLKSSAPTPVPQSSAGQMVTPTPSKWRYVKPAGFDEAAATQIVSAGGGTINDIAPDLPMAISPNGSRFIFCRHRPLRAVTVDLDTLDIEGEIELPDHPFSFSWSPDSERVVYQSEGAGEVLLTVLETSRALRLPKPKNGRIPEGRIIWQSKDELIFFRPSPWDSAVLDLDMLRRRPISDAKNTATPLLPRNDRWAIEEGASITDYSVPDEGAPLFTYRMQPCLSIVDKNGAYNATLSALDLQKGDQILGAPDGSKILRIRGDQAHVQYLGLQKENPLVLGIKLAQTRGLENRDPKDLRALICAPLINPLNGKTVGPDRNLVKAIARVISANDSEAKLWIAHSFSPVHSHDVIADFQELQNGQSTGVAGLCDEDWFAVIGALQSEPLPGRAPDAANKKQFSLRDDYFRGAAIVEEIAVPESRPPPPVVHLESRPHAQNIAVIEGFIRYHHAMSSAGNIAAVVANYAETVDHFDGKMVSRNHILKEETDYHAPGYVIMEDVATPIKIVHLNDSLYLVSYTIVYRRTRPDGRWAAGLADTTLHVDVGTGRPQITLQRAERRNQSKGP